MQAVLITHIVFQRESTIFMFRFGAVVDNNY